MAEVDLEALAMAFRHRPPTEGVADRARLAAEWAGLQPGDEALDIGGGTGDHAAVWAEAGIRAVVLDPADGMIRQAVRRAPAVAGRAEALPFRERSFRLCYFHLSLHYGDWERSLDEAVRILADEGSVWVWTFAPSYLRSSFLSRWFPSASARDLERFPDPEEVADRLEGMGLRVGRGGPVTEIRTWEARAWAVAVREGFIGTLHLLDPAEVEAGLEAFREAYPDPRETISYRLPFRWVAGRLAPGSS